MQIRNVVHRGLRRFVQLNDSSGLAPSAWSLTVTRNWRITFRIDSIEKQIADLDYEDYH